MTDFLVIPAIDIRGGMCVRLLQGSASEQNVFSHDPVEVARSWQEQGATLLHVVDLDGAFEGNTVNSELIKEIIRQTDAMVQVGGGIRDTDSALEYLEAGAHRVVVGSGVFERRGWVKELVSATAGRVAVGLDLKEGAIAVHGWTDRSGMDPVEAIEFLAGAGVPRIIYTSVSRDGMMTGPDIEGISEIACSSPVPVTASGGVRNVEDVLDIYRLRELGVEGVIVGMALYLGSCSLRDLEDALGKGV